MRDYIKLFLPKDRKIAEEFRSRLNTLLIEFKDGVVVRTGTENELV